MRIQLSGRLAAVVLISIVGIRPILAEDKPADVDTPFTADLDGR